ncbi:septation protein IspZ [Endozoicomonas montiporae]|uniref:Inner membrane-spanning protein YciB n=1 Tax=Endozoicomonas montiporae CL-33 TaxID=570277 RepID=A0A142BAU2_9GAMM|nr:septation protein IspZ [Endozoicomonas montiporae]AMO55868.1 intracellular septation protein [Endozoicomonas montiporae CL-33]
MKQLIDFIPLIVFFTIYKMDPRTMELAGQSFELGGPFSATLALMVASVIVYGGMYLKSRHLEKSQMITLVAVILFGGMTLAFHDEMFLKWKAPIVNWIFAAAFLGSQFVGSKTLVQRMMGHVMTLPDAIWTRLNMSWVVFFTLLGAANLFVAFTFHDIWVDFKVFGSLILTFGFVILQFVFLSKYINTDAATSDSTGGIKSSEEK